MSKSMQSGSILQRTERTPRPKKKFANDEIERAPWPELRIFRQVKIEASETADWSFFADRLGRHNTGKGRARAVGSWVLVYASAEELRHMVQQVATSRTKAKEVQRRLAKQFNQQVAQNQKMKLAMADVDNSLMAENRIVEAQAKLDEAKLMDPYGIYFDLEEEVASLRHLSDTLYPSTDKKAWDEAEFAVSAITKVGTTRLGLDLSANRELFDERNFVISFLEDKGLDTSIMQSKDQEWKPHLTAMDTFFEVGRVALQYPQDRPNDILLEAPTAHVNINQSAEI